MIRVLSIFLFFCCFVPGMSQSHAQSTETPVVALDVLPACNFDSDIEVSGLVLGAVVLNLENARGCAENLDTPYPVASVPKLFVLGAFLEEISYGWRDPNAEFVFTEDYVMGGTRDCLGYDQVGQSFTYTYLMEIMISCSDNSATWILMDLMGWDMVQDYINRLGIDGIGPVIPYAEVDRLKLQFLDERWANVPLALASRFYRRRVTDGLVPQYFTSAPNYSRSQRLDANARYFSAYDYNTSTPRAMAEYLLLMRQRLNSREFSEALSAWAFFDTLMLTQRQYSTQDLPGKVYLGAKNGYDFGLKAEVSVAFRSLLDPNPESIIIVFVHQTDLSEPDVGLPADQDDLLNRYLASISPQINFILYPDEPPADFSARSNIASVIFTREAGIERCREESDGSTRAAYLQALSECWRNLEQLTRLPVNERLGLGIIMRGLGNQEARMTMVFTGPDGRQYAYQYNTRFVQEDNIYWYHRLDQVGIWQVDIYQDLQRVFMDTIEAY